MLQSLFYTISSLISVYSLVCLARVVMSWMPNLEYTTVGRFLASVCDPYLNWFRRFSFSRIGAFDFSPIFALGLLSVASMTFSTLAVTGRITVGVILAGILQVLWSFAAFLLNIFIVLMIIRLVYDLLHRYGYSQFWTVVDRMLNPPIARVTGFFFRTQVISYRSSLALTLTVMIVLRVGLGIGVTALSGLLYALPV